MLMKKTFRLDSLSLKEIKILYTRSAYLYQIGVLQFVIGIICAVIGVMILASSSNKFGIIMCFEAFYLFILSSIFKHVRMPASRVFFYLFGISVLGYTLMSLWGMIAGDDAVYFPLVIIYFLLLAISIAVLISATTDQLFGMNAFTHQQIRYAKEKKSNNEPFTDEEIPVKHQEEAKMKVFLIIGYVGEGLAILSFVINLFVGFTKKL